MSEETKTENRERCVLAGADFSKIEARVSAAYLLAYTIEASAAKAFKSLSHQAALAEEALNNFGIVAKVLSSEDFTTSPFFMVKNRNRISVSLPHYRLSPLTNWSYLSPILESNHPYGWYRKFEKTNHRAIKNNFSLHDWHSHTRGGKRRNL